MPSNFPSWLTTDEDKNDIIKECCSEDNPCGVGQGDCDNDSECEGSLTCVRYSCDDSLKNESFFDLRTDCCA